MESWKGLLKPMNRLGEILTEDRESKPLSKNVTLNTKNLFLRLKGQNPQDAVDNLRNTHREILETVH